MIPILWIAVTASGFSGLNFGYDMGVVNGILASSASQDYFAWNNDAERAFVAASFVLGALVSSAMSGWIADRFGRRRSIILSTSVYIVGSVIQTAAVHIAMLYLGRILAGLAVGISFAAIPLYISEISPKRWRGSLMFVRFVCVACGVLFGNMVGYFAQRLPGNASFRVVFGIQIAIALLVIISMLMSPRSPRWLMSRGKVTEAHRALTRLRALPHDSPAVLDELQEIAVSLKQEGKQKVTLRKQLAQPAIRRRFLIVMVLGALQQLCGISALVYYSPDIFRLAGFADTSTQLLMTATENAVAAVANIASTFLVDRVGRKPLMVVGGSLMAGAMFSIGGLLLALRSNPDLPGANYSILAVVFLFMAVFPSTWAPLTWVYISEILPQHLRGNAMALGTTINWLCNFAVSQLTPSLISAMNGGLFIIIASIIALGTIWMQCVLRETKNKSLEEIDAEYGPILSRPK